MANGRRTPRSQRGPALTVSAIGEVTCAGLDSGDAVHSLRGIFVRDAHRCGIHCRIAIALARRKALRSARALRLGKSIPAAVRGLGGLAGLPTATRRGHVGVQWNL